MYRIYFVFFMVLMLVLAGCRTSTYWVEQGRYDKAIDVAVKRLHKNPNREKDILALETAFAQGTARDSSHVAFLKQEQDSANLLRIYEMYEKMEARQQRIRPLLPLHISSENRNAHFHFHNYDERLMETRREASAWLYEQATKLLAEGDRQSARRAYYKLQDLDALNPDYRDVSVLIRQAQVQGSSKIWITMANNTGSDVPPNFKDSLFCFDVAIFNRQWSRYFIEFDSTINYDYHIIVGLRLLEVGPERERERHYSEIREIQDGETYKRDEDGNLVLDAEDEPIKVPKYKMVEAEVIEIQQLKTATVRADIELFDALEQTVIERIAVDTQAVFEHSTATVQGDPRALPEEKRELIGKAPMPFPGNRAMLGRAGKALSQAVSKHIWQRQHLLE